MLYYLLTPLRDDYIFFNLFRYISFRATASAVTALLISLIIGPYVIKLLRKHQIGEEIRQDGPQSHLSKSGTPSMGGIIIIISVVIPTLLFARIGETFVWLVLLSTVWLALLGLLDDYLKIVKKYPKGLVARYKLIGQIVLGLVVGSVIYFMPAVESARSSTTLPFFKNYEIEFFGILYIAFVAFVITASSNGSNLTDGLDGLLIGLIAIAAVAFGVMAYFTGRVDFSDYLNIIYLPGAGELSIYCAALFGGFVGIFYFLIVILRKCLWGIQVPLPWVVQLGTVAVLIKKELLLVLICGIFVIESLSVLIQVFVFKRTGKRVFKMAPLHHHFELLGWPEPKVVIRFWILGILLALLTLTTFKIR